jgi:hypothetical protein
VRNDGKRARGARTEGEERGRQRERREGGEKEKKE